MTLNKKNMFPLLSASDGLWKSVSEEIEHYLQPVTPYLFSAVKS
jgi:hypothetical protein